VVEVLYHHAKFSGARISPAAGVAKNVEFFLSVCLLPAALRAAQPPVFNLIGGRFTGFSLRRGDTLHRWGEIWHGGGD